MKAQGCVIRNRRGSSAIELALLLPIILLLIFGGLEFGLLMYNQQVITNASREGARYGIVNDPDEPFNRVPVSKIEDHVETYVKDRLVTFGLANDPKVSVVRGNLPQENCEVTVTYDYGFLYLSTIPYFNKPRTLTARTLMKNE